MMSRMLCSTLRWSFHIVAALSLSLGIACLALSFHQGPVCPSLFINTHWKFVTVQESNDAIYWSLDPFPSWNRVVTCTGELNPPHFEVDPDYERVRREHRFGTWLTGVRMGGTQPQVGWMPLWSAIAGFALIPASWMWWHWRHFRSGQKCGRVRPSVSKRIYLAGSDLSLILFFGVIFCWVQSVRWRQYEFSWSGGKSFAIDSEHRQCAFNLSAFAASRDETDQPGFNFIAYPVALQNRISLSSQHLFPAFHFEPILQQGPDFMRRADEPRAGTLIGHTLSVPHWFVCLLTAILPGQRLLMRIRRRSISRRRLGRGLCHHCGYDLQGNMSGICPECGKAVELQTVPVDRLS